MIAKEIREFLDREPFVPFRVITSSGKHFDVLNPRLAVLMKSEVFIALPDGETSAHVPLLHVAAVQTLANGRGRKPSRDKRN